jgi:hypothetical protein
MSEIGTGLQNATGIRNAIARAGYAFVEASDMRTALSRFGSLADWPAFAESWNELQTDTYMADGGRYRKRRHAAFGARTDEPVHRKPEQPHYQSRDYNPLNGGIARWFDPVLPAIATGASMTAILDTCRTLFERLSPIRAWHIEVHQFRIEARSGESGQPTPEGMHRDGVDWVFVGLVARIGVAGGVTGIADAAGRSLGSFTLVEPLDAVFLDDHRVRHGVTPIEILEPGRAAHRDVLVLTFRKEA